MAEQDRGMTNRIGPVKIDWPRSIGYFGGIGVAVAAGVIEPPLAIFIAAVPFLKLMNRPRASAPVRFVGQVLDGAAKPVGGDTSATIELASPTDPAPGPQRLSIWQEARQLAGRGASGQQNRSEAL